LNADEVFYLGSNNTVLSYNIYTYCENNAVIYNDKNGHQIVWEAGLGGNASGAALAFTVAAAWGYTQTLPQPLTIPYSLTIPRVKAKDIAISKTKSIQLPPDDEGQTYYHATTWTSYMSIKQSNLLIGSKFEAYYVFAWLMKPTQLAVNGSGAHTGIIISFKTRAPFQIDNGINNTYTKRFFPLKSVFPGPIAVWDVKVVG